MKSKLQFTLAALLMVIASVLTAQEKKSLKIFILAGQSNMVGMAADYTIQAIGLEPETAHMLKDMLDKDGKPVVCDQVYICKPGDGEGPKAPKEKFGKLEVGYGGGKGSRLGPEYGFGIYAYKILGEPILIIKTARGGRDLIKRFRPPSAGPLPLSEAKIAQLKAKGEDIEAAKKKHSEESGYQYRWMMDYIKKVLADPKRVYPDYDPKAGYELAGFAWFQGYNDFVGNYPVIGKKGKLKDYSEYTKLYACFIRDVRKGLNAPNLPFVTGVFGMGGENPANPNITAFSKAQAATAELPEFKGNVFNVFTAKYWPEKVCQLDKKQRALLKGELKLEGEAAKILTEIKEKEKLLGKDTKGKRKEKREISALKNKLCETYFSPDDYKLLKLGRSNQGYHYMGSAKFYTLAGKAFAEALLEQNKANK